MPVWSIARPISPPIASISRTRWPLPIPPIAGLHDIWPIWSRLSVSIRVGTPIRAAAREASIPAWPAPTTITPDFIVVRFIAVRIMARTARRAKRSRLRLYPLKERSSRALYLTICSINLLSDTEFVKHRVEHVLGADLAGKRTQGLGGGRGVDRDDLRRHS